MAGDEVIRWQDIEPKDAVDINLSQRLDITAPLNEEGERCPWPWDPQQLKGAPMGQYHCPYCGAMVMAGLPHIDYTRKSAAELEALKEEHKPSDGRLDYCLCGRSWPCPILEFLEME